MALAAVKQTNIVANRARNLIFFETEELCYNYKTGQWTVIPAYDGLGMYTINNKDSDIGLVRYSSGSVDLQEQLTSYVTQDATITTGERDINEGGRALVTGVRPLISGGDAKVVVSHRDTQNLGTRTNLLLRSEELTAAGWLENGASRAADAVNSPEGKLTADSVTGTSGTGRHVSQSATVTTTDEYTFSVWAKPSDAEAIALSLGGTPAITAVFNLSDGTVISTGDDVLRVTVDGFGSGWYRFSITCVPILTTTFFRFYLAAADGTWFSASPDTVMYLWGAMVEKAGTLGGYILSEAAAGTSDVHSTILTTPNSRSGVAGFRDEGRYHRLKISATAGFDTIMGADVEFAPTGRI